MRVRILLLLSLLLTSLVGQAQKRSNANASQKLLSKTDEKVTIGGYAQIDYNQPVNGDEYNNGSLDVHRMVLLFGYNFSERTQFVSEIEMEHVKELYVEQAWLNHRITNGVNFRGGLMLIPMGRINEYHEPTTFNGVERPNVDKYIVPTTWREIGVGFNGYLSNVGLNYQVYLVNGFNGYDGNGKLSGKSGLRSGRQKGAESYISSPNLAFKTELSSITNLKLGLSGYVGKTQSTLYDGLDRNDAAAKAHADSSVIGLSMIGLDGSYTLNKIIFKGQYIFANLSNTSAYNHFTGSDVGSALQGYYIEAAYHHYLGDDYRFTPFVRYENYNTHLKVDDSMTKNLDYNRTELTFGASLLLSGGAVLKADYQVFSNAGSSNRNGQLNFGIGIWF